MAQTLRHISIFILTVQTIYLGLVPVGVAEESRGCREQEFRDLLGTCRACQRCGAGEELSKECGFGYGVDARCVGCRTARFKEDQGLQKCKPCLDCGALNRSQKTNCSASRNAACGDCLPGFYRKTKLSGFQDMECILCGDPPPPYEPHCSGLVNRVPLPSVASSPRDVALAAVICSALATVLLALLVLCVIYCKRQLLEKKPPASLCLQDGPYGGAELSCLDQSWLPDFPETHCCRCHLSPAHTCAPVHLIPSLCWEQSCHLDLDRRGPGVYRSQMSLDYRTPDQDKDKDQDQRGAQDPTRSESPSAETWFPEPWGVPVAPHRSPAGVRQDPTEEGEEEEEESWSEEDLQRNSPDTSSLDG